MLMLKKGLMAVAALGAATLMSGATPKNAAACEGDDCAMQCSCLTACAQNYPPGPQQDNCRYNCYYMWQCDIEYLCP